MGIGEKSPSEKLSINGNLSVKPISATSDIKTTKNINAIGNITANNIITRDEMHTLATGDSKMLAAAYETISATGSVLTGSGNFTVDHTETGKYIIRLKTQVIYDSSCAVVSLAAGSYRGLINHEVRGPRADVGDTKGGLFVYPFDSFGDQLSANNTFSFILYKR